MAEQYWAACQTTSGREHVIRAEIEKAEHGAFLPTFARTWVAGGKLSRAECPLVPGYVFFRTTPEGWGKVKNIDGVQQVLSQGLRAFRVNDRDMARMVLSHATGAFNRIEARLPAKRRRRPRPGRRIRNCTAV